MSTACANRFAALATVFTHVVLSRPLVLQIVIVWGATYVSIVL